MTKFLSEIFGDLDLLASNFLKKIQRMMNEIDVATKNETLKGNWNVKQIDESGVKGYIIQGRFWSDEPLEPFNPFKPFDPQRPLPKRPFNAPKSGLKETREPLTDVFDEEKEVKIYVELPGEKKDDIQLNVTEGEVEIKTKNFLKIIDVPAIIDIENASSKYKNGVLEVTIPKKEMSPDRKIKIS